MAFISIITPTFNSAKYIRHCIKNVQEQDYKDFEHIIIDGASSDKTVAIIEQAASNYKNIKWASNKDSGIYDAMNRGISISTGKWLFFLGCDDYFFDNTVLKHIVPNFSLSDSCLEINYGNVLFEKMKMVYDGEFDIEKILTHNICHQSIFYSKGLFDVFGFYNLKYKIQADYHFNLKCWLSDKVKHKYLPVTVAVFADGGKSSAAIDPELVKDYPKITIEAAINANWTVSIKINILSKIFRKLIIRYAYKIVLQQFTVNKLLGLKVAAFLWMIFLIPVRIAKKFIIRGKPL